MGKIIKENPGTRYGYWVVESFAGFDKRHNAMWNCVCTACGERYSIRGFSLRAGTSRHCKHCNHKGFDGA